MTVEQSKDKIWFQFVSAEELPIVDHLHQSSYHFKTVGNSWNLISHKNTLVTETQAASSHLFKVHDIRQEGGSGQFCDEAAWRQLLVFIWTHGFLFVSFPALLSHQVSLQEAVWSAEVPDEGLFNRDGDTP